LSLRARLPLAVVSRRAAALLAFALAASAAGAEPSVTGQSGLVHMPDARLAPDGTWRLGLAHSDPYFTVWSSVSLFPRLEVSGRYTRIDGVPGFPEAPGLGNYRDKAFDAKLLLRAEDGPWPAVAIGAQDYFGTQLFQAQYLALSKRYGPFDVTLGYGNDRIDGTFGGVRYTPASAPRWRFVFEYDATDYARDFEALRSGAAGREGGATYAIGYHADWWGAQLGYQRGEAALNLYLTVPLMADEFVPKIHEPPPYDAPQERASAADWAGDGRHAQALARTLEQQGYVDVRVRLRGRTLELALGHERISLMSRAVGRAARTALHLGPRDLEALHISYTEREQPFVTYVFRDPDVLARYFAGRASRAELEARTDVTFASSALARELRHEPVMWLDENDTDATADRVAPDAFLEARRRAGPLEGAAFHPFSARIHFNEPGAPLRYDTFAVGAYARRLARGLWINGALRLTLFENVSDIDRPSNSLLPHVRTDIGEYRRLGDRLRLNSLLLNKYAMLHERLYARMSLGYYEEMFAGAGAQALYLPARGDWAFDVSVDALRQRAPGSAFGFRDYRVVTALAAAHYRFPAYGVTATARFGRFLARDEGVRLELKRRFRSGVEIGAWHTWTDAKDVTSPGTPEEPYRDKGIFMSIPLNSMLTYDTRERATLALADYTRDVGQMVVSPGDLYELVERPGVLEGAPFADFAR